MTKLFVNVEYNSCALQCHSITNLRRYPAQKCHTTPNCFLPDWQPKEATASSRMVSRIRQPTDDAGASCLDSLFLGKLI